MARLTMFNDLVASLLLEILETGWQSHAVARVRVDC